MITRKLFYYALMATLVLISNTTNILAQSWLPLGNEGFTEGEAWSVSLDINAIGEPYVAYIDYANSNKASVMKFDGTNWVQVGNKGFSEGIVRSTSLAFGPNGVPHVVFQDDSNSNKSTVMKFDGTNWVTLGMPGFTSGLGAETRLVFSPQGMPYVSYVGFNSPVLYAGVMKFDGTNWVEVGSTTSPLGGIRGSLAFNSLGEPHLGYKDDNSKKVIVKKFDGTNWIPVGISGFSDGEVSAVSLKFSPNTDEPYVAYIDYANSKKVTVMKFDGTNWISVGMVGFSEDRGIVNKLAFNTSGEPYVSFIDFANSRKCTVMKFNGTNWSTVGMSGFTPIMTTGFHSLKLSSNGTPYLAYHDTSKSGKATVMKFSSNLSIDDLVTNKSTLKIYPNPVKDFLIISNIPRGTKLNIIDFMGKTVFHSTANNQEVTINTEGYANGIYIVQASKNGVISTKKLVVN